jgi:endonuclease YncB( thermonuclease family)
MRRSPLAVLTVCLLMLLTNVPVGAQDTVSCTNYDAWEWAQAVFESDPQKYDALDPDNDGTACPELPPGFAPAFWTDSIPEDVQEAQMIRIVDGDTFEVLINGVSNRIRIYRADTPETQNEQHCGGAEATAFVDWVLSWNEDPGTVYIEKDKNEKDRYGRELGYIWFEVGGQPYMLNHVLINNGYAEDVDYGDRKYDQQFKDAAAFADRHDLGVWALCGGFGIPATQAPSVALPQPAAPVPLPVEPAPPPVQEPAPPPVAAPAPGCDPNYTPCIPSHPPDLDCPQIGITVTVIGGDPHRLDRDNDGAGCE